MSEVKCNCDPKAVRAEQFKELKPVMDEYAGVKGSLITILQKAQGIYGYISVDCINYISDVTGIRPARIYGVATFYAQFRLQPIGKYLIMLCQGTACHVNGSETVADAVCEYLGVEDGETTPDGLFTINKVACLGCCSLAPVMMIRSKDEDETFGQLTKDSVVEIIKDYQKRG